MYFDTTVIDHKMLSIARDLMGRLGPLPDMPAARIDKVYYHWSASRYDTVYPDYNLNVVRADGVWIAAYPTPVALNATSPPQDGYAAHTYRRNAHAVGITAACMLDATPGDFGDFPLLIEQVRLLCALGGAVCALYGIDASDPSCVMTHAEAAVADGYFVTDRPLDGITRWDLARFSASDEPLTKSEAIESGDRLRALTQTYASAM